MILFASSSSNAQTIKRSKQKTEQTQKSNSTKSRNITSKSSTKTENPKLNKSSSKKSKSQKADIATSDRSLKSTSSDSGYSVPKVESITVNGISFEMIFVEGGTFTMGATNERGGIADSDDKQPHQVTLSGYFIGKYEVTQELWQAVMGSNPSYFKDNSRYPVERISWYDCQEFITKLNHLTGKCFRLPTEAEWEYAARGGKHTRGYTYAGSNNLANVAWHANNSINNTHPVGQKSPNELGLYDMSGNVCEWCQDWYGSYGSSSQTNPTGPSWSSKRVHRGGNIYLVAERCQVSLRNSASPNSYYSFLGLRLAATSL